MACRKGVVLSGIVLSVLVLSGFVLSGIVLRGLGRRVNVMWVSIEWVCLLLMTVFVVPNTENLRLLKVAIYQEPTSHINDYICRGNLV